MDQADLVVLSCECDEGWGAYEPSVYMCTWVEPSREQVIGVCCNAYKVDGCRLIEVKDVEGWLKSGLNSLLSCWYWAVRN